MASVNRRLVEVDFDDLTDVLSAFVAGTTTDRVLPAPCDGHLLVERDASGNVIGVEVLNASALRYSFWQTHPDRNILPYEILQVLDSWISSRAK